MMTLAPEAEIAVGIFLVTATLWYTWRHGLPLLTFGGATEEGTLAMWPQCEYGAFAWNATFCYGKQAAVVVAAVAGFVFIYTGARRAAAAQKESTALM